ncbi:hypothetical protein DFP72DRAFT_898043 [Ephemerocybe angulata]|uniref:Nephrocystin 3-like N-terminal domain-containing protein n=1 Tax=Ephemerocybe angulata TaxID=980116 RepID=A0A8H6M446_9AGAR|nr:hypothetical protein DFP72DRAFT_898043 [Tulosesus angulatus]
MPSSVSHFENAQNFKVEKLQINTNVSYAHSDCPSRSPSKSPLECLVDNMATGAVHDSAERCDAPKCHPETRIAVQEEILSWISHGDADVQPKKILWVTGPAGTGKTAILGSIADDCQDMGLLAASFFFSSSSVSTNRRSKRYLIPTIAYQLLQNRETALVGQQALSFIERNPAIFEKRLKEQLEELILKPLRTLKRQPGTDPYQGWPKVVVIDGLDECEAEQYHDPLRPASGSARRSKEDDHAEILSVLVQATEDPAFPFRIVVASRPERAIRQFFNELGSAAQELFLDEKYDPDADITLFFTSKFAEIRRRYKLPQHWPNERVIGILVENASGQFIYAATVMRFIESPPHPPQIQLECVLRSRAVDGTSPFAPLDSLYRCILQTSPNPPLSAQWLYAIDHLRSAQADFVQQFLESTPGEAEYLLGSLSSILTVVINFGSWYTFYHKSFVDFLEDRSRSTTFYIDRESRKAFCQRRYLRVLKNKGPMTPIKDPLESEAFLRQYTRLGKTGFLCASASQFTLIERELVLCDAAWWLQTFFDTSESRKSTSYWDFLHIQDLFEHVHAWCHWYKCRPACKHWRRHILKACVAQRWLVPGKAELIWNRFDHRVDWTGTLCPIVESESGSPVSYSTLHSASSADGPSRGILLK